MNKYKVKEMLEAIAVDDIKNKSTEELNTARNFLSKLLTYRAYSKTVNTFINGPKKALEYTGKDSIYSSFKQDGTVTGRLSCAMYSAGPQKPMGISFHTLPKNKKDFPIKIRESFVAPEGWAFIAADYSTMELRVLAHVAGIERMKEAFNEDRDLHNQSASMIFAKPVEEVTPEDRAPAKITSFLTVYGGGAPNLSQAVGIPLKRAEWVINRFYEVYPELPLFMDSVRGHVEEHKKVETIFGRVRHLDNIDSRDRSVAEKAFRQGLNTLIQGPASDIMLCALLGIIRDSRELGLRGRAIAIVHDSVEIICPKEEIDEFVKIIQKNMVDNPIMNRVLKDPLTVKLKADFEIGTSFGNVIHADVESGIIKNREEIFSYVESNQCS